MRIHHIMINYIHIFDILKKTCYFSRVSKLSLTGPFQSKQWFFCSRAIFHLWHIAIASIALYVFIALFDLLNCCCYLWIQIPVSNVFLLLPAPTPPLSLSLSVLFLTGNIFVSRLALLAAIMLSHSHINVIYTCGIHCLIGMCYDECAFFAQLTPKCSWFWQWPWMIGMSNYAHFMCSIWNRTN